MKCDDCIYFGYYATPIGAIGYCAYYKCCVDPEDDGECNGGEPIELIEEDDNA